MDTHRLTHVRSRESIRTTKPGPQYAPWQNLDIDISVRMTTANQKRISMKLRMT